MAQDGKKEKSHRRFLLVVLMFPLLAFPSAAQDFEVLVFSKTAGFRHPSISDGIALIQELGDQNEFGVLTSEDSSDFSEANLSQYEAVVFLNTSGDILNSTQEAAFEQFIRNGGGFVGVHAASDTEYDWLFYDQLLGTHFCCHPAIQPATVCIENSTHISTRDLPLKWRRTDEWYNFQANPRGDVEVLLTLDESSYEGGTMGEDHPISWFQEFQGGRAWYTGMGHTRATYTEPEFVSHLLGGILYAAGVADSPFKNPRSDIDGSGTVDAMDLLILMEDWGKVSGVSQW